MPKKSSRIGQSSPGDSAWIMRKVHDDARRRCPNAHRGAQMYRRISARHQFRRKAADADSSSPRSIVAAAAGDATADQVRDAIRHGRIPPGARLPSSREFAEQLYVGRNTVVRAYETLTMEGFVETHAASGVFAARDLPNKTLQPAFARADTAAASAATGLMRAPAVIRRRSGKARPPSHLLRFPSRAAESEAVSGKDLETFAAGLRLLWRGGRHVGIRGPGWRLRAALGNRGPSVDEAAASSPTRRRF